MQRRRVAAGGRRYDRRMAEPFKKLLHAGLVRQAAARLQRTAPGLDARRFVALACEGLEALELKARAPHISAALEASLPSGFAQAVDALPAALAPASAAADCGEGLELGLRGWILWPAGECIARRGQHAPERSLQALPEENPGG